MLKFKSASMQLLAPWPAVDPSGIDDDSGIVEAYVSVFGNVDRDNDRVLHGAFASNLDAWKSSGDPIPFVWAHQWFDPDAHVGVVTDAQERDKGLWVRAQLDMEAPKAQQVFKLLKGRRVRNFSYAYDVLDFAYDDSGVCNLKQLDLIECGPCLAGVNPLTDVESVKGMQMSPQLLTAATLLASPNALRAATRATRGKVGRVLSGNNETSVRRAIELLTEVLQQLEKEDGKAALWLARKQADGEDADDDPGTLAQALDAALDAMVHCMTPSDDDFNIEQAYALLIGAEAISDQLLDALGVPDADDVAEAQQPAAMLPSGPGAAARRPISKGAVASHHTSTVDHAWDGQAANTNAKSGEDASYYRQVYAWQDPNGDAGSKSSWALPHHEVSSDGKPGAANVRGAIAAIGVLNGARGGSRIPADDRSAVHSHLATHLKDAGVDVTPLKSLDEITRDRDADRERDLMLSRLGVLDVV